MQADHHATLGVARNASPAAIRTAYRKLARQWHPDLNPANEATEAFARINAAYAALSGGADGARRAAQAPPSATEAVRCSDCGGLAAQPRILTFHAAVGLLVWSRILRTEGVFCARCARAAGLRASRLTAFAGWWAIPFGPAIALGCIAMNAAGGRRHAVADQRLQLTNAKAFLEAGEATLAGAVARTILKTASPPEADRARRLLALAQAQGALEVVLRNSWRPPASYLAWHLLMLLAAPAAVVAAVVLRPG